MATMTTVDPGSDLHLSATYVGERARIVAQGNLDVYTAPLLRAQLSDAVDAGARRITLIVRGVNLIDSSGLSALVFGYKLAVRCDGRFTLCGADMLSPVPALDWFNDAERRRLCLQQNSISAQSCS